MAYKSKIHADPVEENPIGVLVRKAETDFKSGTTTISEYVQISLSETINKIYAYLNSKHTTGSADSMGRDKPFFNIVTAARNIWFRSTDIDRGQIKVLATNSKSVIQALLATVCLQDWMRKESFGIFLNDWGRTLASFGSAITKWIEKEGRLIPSIVAWNRVIVDPIDFDNNAKIEILEYTEAQLKQNKAYDQDIVKKLCDAVSVRKTTEGQQQDNKSGYIRLYEVHGLFPKSYLTGESKDEDEYTQQMHVISFLASNEKGKFDDFTLYSGKEERDPYYITHLIKEDGQTLSIGAVQHLFEAQWMMNHSVKAIKDQLDLASKLIFQTADGTFVGQNALDAIENGDILIHAINQPITQIANTSHDISSLQSFANQWKALSNEITGISESMLGNAAPSGTAWRQVETLLQQNQSLFDLMTENKGLDIEEMAIRYMIPHIKKNLKHSDEISAILESHDIDKIDSIFIKNKAIQKTKSDVSSLVASGQMPTQTDVQSLMNQNSSAVKESLSPLGNQRFFKPSELTDATWKEILKDFEWDISVDVTGESVDKDAATTLNTLLMFFAKKQGQPLTPEEKFTINKILNLSGAVSPLELASISNAPKPLASSPIQSPVPQQVT